MIIALLGLFLIINLLTDFEPLEKVREWLDEK